MSAVPSPLKSPTPATFQPAPGVARPPLLEIAAPFMSQMDNCVVPLFCQRMSLLQLPSKSEVAAAEHFAAATAGIALAHAAMKNTAATRLNTFAARFEYAAPRWGTPEIINVPSRA
jgi:hypothetical protein